MFCSNCGSEVKEGQAICLNCGFAIKPSVKVASTEDNYFGITNANGASRGAAILLNFLLGAFGAHRFYMKAPHSWLMLSIGIMGILLVFPLVFTGIWSFIDLIRMLVADKNEYNHLFLEVETQ